MSAIANAAIPMVSHAIGVVIRAREGDQNAIALITEVRDAAKAGSKKAAASLKEIMDYITKNPVKVPEASIGAEAQSDLRAIANLGPVDSLPAVINLQKDGDDAVWAGAVLLSQGPILNTPLVDEISAGIADEGDRQVFLYAVNNSHLNVAKEAKTMMPETRRIFIGGLCIGVAQDIQRVRAKGSTITRFSPMAGWELGEDLSLQPAPSSALSVTKALATSLLDGSK